MKRQKWNFTTRKFYLGVILILLCFACGVWLIGVRKAALPMSTQKAEMIKTYVDWLYEKDWENIIGATVKYDSGSLHDWEYFNIEFDEGAEHYEIYHAPGHVIHIKRSGSDVIGSFEGIEYVSMDVSLIAYFSLSDEDEIDQIIIADEHGESFWYSISELNELPVDATIFRDADDTLQIVNNKIELIAKQHKKAWKPYLYLSLITVAALGIWFFLMPPMEFLQKDEKLKKKRYLGAGILTVTFGVWLSILGGIVAALIECRLENNLLQEDKAFCMKCVIPSLVINLGVGFLLFLLITNQIFVGFPLEYCILVVLSAIGVFFGYGAFGTTYGIKEDQKRRKERR